MKNVKTLLFALFAIALIFASCSNSSDTPQAPINLTNPETNESLDPRIEFTRFVIPRVDIAYAGQTVMVTLVGKYFPDPFIIYADETDNTKNQKRVSNFLSSISITCQKDPSIVDGLTFSFINSTPSTINHPSLPILIAHMTIPNDIGMYDITVSYGKESITATLSVQDYSAYHPGDLLLKDGSVIPYDETCVFSDKIKEKAIEQSNSLVIAIINVIESIVLIVFSILLIFSPTEHHAHVHIILLGIELMLEVIFPVLDEIFYKMFNKNKLLENIQEKEKEL